jgi:hypothetical protein
MLYHTDNRNLIRGKSGRASIIAAAKGLIALLITVCVVGAAFAQDAGWPREKSNGSGTLTYYQPQLDEWKDFKRLDARMAISIEPTGSEPVLGVVSFRARTDANLDTRNVVVSRLKIISVRFPSLDAAQDVKMETLVRGFLPPTAVVNINLDRLLAELEEAKRAPAPVVAVRNDPPRIFVAYDKAILLLVDGELVRAPIEKGPLEFVVNTNWNIFFDKTESRYYLLNEQQWLTAKALENDEVAQGDVGPAQPTELGGHKESHSAEFPGLQRHLCYADHDLER